MTRWRGPRQSAGHRFPATSTARGTTSSRRTTTSASDEAAAGAQVKGCQPRTLTPYLDREWEDDPRLEVSQPPQGCPTCSTLLDELSRASQQVRSMGRAEIARSALQPALEIFTDGAGLPRAPAAPLAGAGMV